MGEITMMRLNWIGISLAGVVIFTQVFDGFEIIDQ
jgi:hypothetical protein